MVKRIMMENRIVNAVRTIAESLYAEILVLKSCSKLYTSEGCERVAFRRGGEIGRGLIFDA